MIQTIIACVIVVIYILFTALFLFFSLGYLLIKDVLDNMYDNINGVNELNKKIKNKLGEVKKCKR